MIKFLKRFVFSFNLISIILLFASYASTLTDPEQFWPLVFLGLAFPFLILVNIFFFIFWLFLLNRRALYSLIALLIGSPYIKQTVQFNDRDQPGSEVLDSSIRIISYNTALSGYFQSKWYTPETIEKITQLKPDIFCMQEFLNIGKKTGETTLDSISKSGEFPYHYFEKLNDKRKRGEYGLVIFSKYRITNAGRVDFDQKTGNMCIFADIEIDSCIYRFYNIHLQSFRFKKKDYNFIENLPDDNKEKIAHSKNILGRMKDAFIKRALQVKSIQKNIRSISQPYFLVGDFNDPPVSYAYNILAKDMKDAFMENGSGMGKTYVGIMPNYRIDYILYPKSFRGIKYKAYQLQSDHKLIETIIQKN